MLRNATAFCFSPSDSEQLRMQLLRANRKSPVQPSQIDRSKDQPQRFPGERYCKDAYTRAVRRACEAAFPTPDDLTGDELKAWKTTHRWSPNRLRHSAATAIRRQFGLEAAQVVLGHSGADVTQVYAERDGSLAAKIMGEIG